MKLNEIQDPKFAAALKNLQATNRPRPQPLPGDMDARRQRQDEFQARRQRVEQALEGLAQKFSGEQFELFKQAAEQQIPADELKLVSLDTMWRQYNPEAKSQNAKAWDDHQVEPGAGPVPGVDNWTGD